MLRINKQGFTLIELMVVIVIIGVLASLAIPRFTEASLKAKVAEAPGVLKGYESAFLAAIAEKGEGEIKDGDLIYKAPQGSKWFEYTKESDKKALEGECIATAQKALKSTLDKKTLSTKINDDQEFDHSSDSEELAKLVPNFKATTTAGGGGGGNTGGGE
jgi:prepilin-type N-terminal cleavage/methylation domain-containing protein